MADEFYNPIRPVDPAGGHRIPVPGVRGDKPSREDQEPFFHDDTYRQKLLYGSVVLFFQKMFNTALFTREESGQYSKESIAEAIKKFHHLLETLKKLDQTDNPHFAQELSEAWHVLTSATPGTPLDELIELANDYPSGDTQSLGFYLTHYAGDHWLPFPFLEILKKLHQGYVLRKTRSELQHMLYILEQAIAYFSL